MPDFRKPHEKRICGFCLRRFREHEDCIRCYVDAEAVRVRDTWPRDPMMEKFGMLIDDEIMYVLLVASREA